MNALTPFVLSAMLLGIGSVLTDPASAQPARAEAASASLEGRVVDGSGGAIAGAIVSARAERSSFERFAETGRDGVFQFAGLEPGPHTIAIVAPGFSTAVRNVMLPAARINSVSLGFVASRAQLDALLARENLDPGFRPVLNRLFFTYKNVEDALTQGIELDGEAALSPNWLLAGAYTYLEARDRATGFDLTNRSPHQAHVRLAYALDRIGLRANLRGNFLSSWIVAQRVVDGIVENMRAGAYGIWDAYVSQRVGRACRHSPRSRTSPTARIPPSARSEPMGHRCRPIGPTRAASCASAFAGHGLPANGRERCARRLASPLCSSWPSVFSCRARVAQRTHRSHRRQAS